MNGQFLFCWHILVCNYIPCTKNKWQLPDDKGGPGWIGISTLHDTLPLRTKYLKASQVLEFRDQAFDKYFKNQNYLTMIKNKFGEETQKHISMMSEHKLKRKHQFEEVSY